jgi:hypothetical protein
MTGSRLILIGSDFKEEIDSKMSEGTSFLNMEMFHIMIMVVILQDRYLSKISNN